MCGGTAIRKFCFFFPLQKFQFSSNPVVFIWAGLSDLFLWISYFSGKVSSSKLLFHEETKNSCPYALTWLNLIGGNYDSHLACLVRLLAKWAHLVSCILGYPTCHAIYVKLKELFWCLRFLKVNYTNNKLPWWNN